MKNNKNINEIRILKIIIIILLSVIICISLFGIKKKATNDEIKFKETYEDLNGKTSKSGSLYREITIPEDNNIVISSFEEINKMVDKKKTFYVYFGFESCPWCRSVVEKMIEISKKQGIKKIYYVDVRPGVDDEKTDLRDEYALDDNGKVYLQRKGSNAYHIFQKKFDKVLNPYSRGDIKTLDGTLFEGAKRLGAPNIIYVKKGVPKKLTSGISEKQTDGYMKLTSDILKDEEDIFTEFFK